MFTLISCPTCQHKFSVPEAAMGKRHVCPHCESPFMAGRSVAEPAGMVVAAAVEDSAYNKTMLGATEPPGLNKTFLGATASTEAVAGDAAPPSLLARARVSEPDAALNRTMLGTVEDHEPTIAFSCTRCKTSLEAPAREAGVKKHCPACGQRLQVPSAAAQPGASGAAPVVQPPAAPVSVQAPPPADPALSKTVLGGTDALIHYHCVRCKKPLAALPVEAGTKKPCPACGQRLEVPAAQSTPPLPVSDPALNKTMLGGTEPPIRFDCPRCKKPLEVPALEAGSKRPCPSCGQRVQVPAASAAVVPGLNKTVLGGAESIAPAPPVSTYEAPLNKTMLGNTEPPIYFDCPRCRKPLEALAAEAGRKKPCPGCGQRVQVPAASAPRPMAAPGPESQHRPSAPPVEPHRAAGLLPWSQWPRPYKIASIVGGSLLLLLLLLLLLPSRDREKLEAAQKKIDELTRQIEKNQQDMVLAKQKEQLEMDARKRLEEKERQEAELKRQLDDRQRSFADEQRRLEDRRNLELMIMDSNLREQAKAKREQDERALRQQQQALLEQQRRYDSEQQQRRAEREQQAQEHQRRLEYQQQLQNQQQMFNQQLLSQQHLLNNGYYNWYHPRYYFPW